MKKFAVFMILLLTPLLMSARYLYFNEYFGYGELDNQQGKRLVIENPTCQPMIKTIDLEPTDVDFDFSAVVANNHNDNRRHAFFDLNGNKSYEKNPSWGIILRSAGLSYVVKLSLSQSSDWEYVARECLKVELCRYSPDFAEMTILEEKNLYADDVELFKGQNTISINSGTENIDFFIGKGHQKEVFSFQSEEKITSIGFVVFPGGSIDVESVEMETSEALADKLLSEHTASTIIEYLHHSSDELEGYWQVLDRTFDENLLRLGGNYVLAMVRKEYGYDMLYVGGADILSRQWQPGMIKIKLMATDIKGVFRVVWYDSEMVPMSKDIIAQVENDNLITMTFPYQNSTIRFYKKELPTSGSSTASRHSTAE